MSLATRLTLAVIGTLLLAFGIFAWIQSLWILIGAIQQAWIVRMTGLSWISTIASLATPFLGAFFLWRAWSQGRPDRRVG